MGEPVRMNLLVVLLKSVHFKFLGFPKIQNVCQVSKLLGQHPEATKGSFTWESLKSTLGSFRVRTSDLKCWESEVNLPPPPRPEHLGSLQALVPLPEKGALASSVTV